MIYFSNSGSKVGLAILLIKTFGKKTFTKIFRVNDTGINDLIDLL